MNNKAESFRRFVMEIVKRIFVLLFAMLLCVLSSGTGYGAEQERKYIKWVDFGITSQAMSDAAKIDCTSHGSDHEISWIELLSLLGVKYGGDFSRYKKSDLDYLSERIKNGENAANISGNPKLYAYYLEAYGAVLGGMLGEYREISVSDGKFTEETKYGVRVFSPIAAGYGYSHYDDFGAQRSYGYRRNHLGHDLMGSVGTPIIAVEGGYVEACGWNRFGGWRIGIRSFDGKRYYYYAHLRKDNPYEDIYEGKIVDAGEVIGYLGMTGYSTKENVNNINVPHLHFGLQLIFDKSQKDGNNQIWIDIYAITEFLSSHRAVTEKVSGKMQSKKVKIPDNSLD